ncbi:Ultraviolet-B receptor UVR8 [Glycine soja]|uniref:Ultraviolet-B receptor UVR8 n=1 Tax=Glycine soja TaxID=3848 RepID=A0A445KMI1_GLYSO|nr:Ultraviolet-B receptor UVR8 [Glycine soja]
MEGFRSCKPIQGLSCPNLPVSESHVGEYSEEMILIKRHHRQLPLHAQGLAASTLSPLFGGILTPIPTDLAQGREGGGAGGPSYILSAIENGTVYSFGSGANFCLGHGDQHDELQPHPIQKFRRKGIHIVRISARDEHAVAVDSNGFVYTWRKGYCGALGHGDEIDNITPELLTSLKNQLVVQVCVRKRKTFVLVNSGSMYGFGSMGFGSLGFLDRRVSDKVLKPRILDTLRAHHVSQISTGLYHTMVITSRGHIFGFGDNERAQLGHDTLTSCLEPTQIFIKHTYEDVENT